MKNPKFTVCIKVPGYRLKKLIQYGDPVLAKAHAQSLDPELCPGVMICEANPERVVELRGRDRSCVGYKKVGLPQR